MHTCILKRARLQPFRCVTFRCGHVLRSSVQSCMPHSRAQSDCVAAGTHLQANILAVEAQHPGDVTLRRLHRALVQRELVHTSGGSAAALRICSGHTSSSSQQQAQLRLRISSGFTGDICETTELQRRCALGGSSQSISQL